MKLKKFNIFGISAGWPFWLVDGFAAAAIGWAIYYNYFVLTTGLGVGLPLLLIVLGAFLGITAVFYLARWAFSKTIDGQTLQGTFVIIDKRVKENLANGLLGYPFDIKNVIWEAGLEIDSIKNFWLNWYGKGIKFTVDQLKEKLDQRFNGAFLIVNPEPFIQQSSLGPMAWLTGKLMGLQQGNQAVVVWNPKVNPGITGLRNIIRHEMGHMALEALNINPGKNGDSHHLIFAESGYGV